MDPVLAIGLGVPLCLAVAVLISYNRFVSQRQLIRNSWSNVETELQRRYDLIPNLVDTVKGYAAHERDLFERVAAARTTAQANRGPVALQAHDEQRFVGAVRDLIALGEAYPDL